MKFFGREQEIAVLRKERELARENSRFTVITGRRRIGKTELIDQALNDRGGDYVYLLLTRQNEKNLVASLQQAVVEQLGDKIAIYGTCEKLIDLVREIFRVAEVRPLTLVIDEFQEMDRINPAFYGALQGLWDSQQKRMKINLVVSGSVNRMMNKIFFNYGEPLYGRNTAHLKLKPFTVALLKEIFSYYSADYTNEDLLTLWAITGGVARYVALLMDAWATTRAKMLETVFSVASPFIEEGKSILVQEFGNDYATYFTILSAIAAGHTKFAEIKNDLGSDIGSYLSNLEKTYELVSKVTPIFAPIGSKNATYRIEDSFLRFWFRYVFKNAALVELGRFEALRNFVDKDLNAFAGISLERYFRAKFAEESSYTQIGGWWDRKGENEIDLVCEDEFEKKLCFFEVKMDASRISIEGLKRKSEAFFTKNPDKRDLEVAYKGLSLGEM